MKYNRWCGDPGGERVPPAALGWYLQLCLCYHIPLNPRQVQYIQTWWIKSTTFLINGGFLINILTQFFDLDLTSNTFANCNSMCILCEVCIVFPIDVTLPSILLNWTPSQQADWILTNPPDLLNQFPRQTHIQHLPLTVSASLHQSLVIEKWISYSWP